MMMVVADAQIDVDVFHLRVLRNQIVTVSQNPELLNCQNSVALAEF
jgi:hypothetical protein